MENSAINRPTVSKAIYLSSSTIFYPEVRSATDTSQSWKHKSGW